MQSLLAIEQSLFSESREHVEFHDYLTKKKSLAIIDRHWYVVKILSYFLDRENCPQITDDEFLNIISKITRVSLHHKFIVFIFYTVE